MHHYYEYFHRLSCDMYAGLSATPGDNDSTQACFDRLRLELAPRFPLELDEQQLEQMGVALAELVKKDEAEKILAGALAEAAWWAVHGIPDLASWDWESAVTEAEIMLHEQEQEPWLAAAGSSQTPPAAASPTALPTTLPIVSPTASPTASPRLLPFPSAAPADASDSSCPRTPPPTMPSRWQKGYRPFKSSAPRLLATPPLKNTRVAKRQRISSAANASGLVCPVAKRMAKRAEESDIESDELAGFDPGSSVVARFLGLG